MNILTYNYKFEFKKLLKERISSLIDNLSDDLIDSLFSSSHNKYVSFFNILEQNIKNLIITIIVELIDFFDEKFRNSKERKDNYHINIRKNRRGIELPIGFLEFNRTYYETKDRKNHFYFIDSLLGLDKYSRYDSITKATSIDYTIKTNQKLAGELTRDKFNTIEDDFFNYRNNSIPRQTINRWIKDWNIPKIKYNPIDIDSKTLYIMADEKWIHEQIFNRPEEDKGKRKYIMSKCFIAFSGIDQKKNRRTLKDKFVFITSENAAWDNFLDSVAQIYDFSKLDKIVFLSDAGTWLLSGAPGLKLYQQIKIIFCLCEFHVRQKVNRITTNEEYRNTLNTLIDENKKEEFKKFMETIKDEKKDNAKRLSKLEEYENYIIKHWSKIQNMFESECKSSMESHISHCVAGYFSSRPKAYGRKNIQTLIKLKEAELNGINIKQLYLESYKDKEQKIYNQKELDFSIFEKSSPSNIPIIGNGLASPIYSALTGLAHSCNIF